MLDCNYERYGIEKYLDVQGEQNTEQIFSLLYEYLDQYRPQIYRILLKNRLEGRCMASLRAFMKKQIGQIINKCPGTGGFLLGSVEKEAHKK